MVDEQIAVNARVEVADQLLSAERARSGIAPPAERYPGLSVIDAYEIQRINVNRVLDSGAVIMGHKIGLTSQAMQDQLGVDQPDFGVITDRMVIEDDGRLDVAELVSPRVEAELAFRLSADLSGADVTIDEVRHAIGEAMLALEIIDSRIEAWRISLVDTVADNASSARVVFGKPVPATDEVLDSLPALVLTLTQDEQKVAEGVGAEVLDHPLNAVLWLVRQLAAFGAGLRAGELVLAGAVHGSLPLTARSTWTVSSPDRFSPATLRTR